MAIGGGGGGRGGGGGKRRGKGRTISGNLIYLTLNWAGGGGPGPPNRDDRGGGGGGVHDPDGKPVAGATVAAAHTGTGNSITGDTRFSVLTGKDGAFLITLPASGNVKYNLEAHDGAHGQWRYWANGVVPPIQTNPGDEL